MPRLGPRQKNTSHIRRSHTHTHTHTRTPIHAYVTLYGYQYITSHIWTPFRHTCKWVTSHTWMSFTMAPLIRTLLSLSHVQKTTSRHTYGKIKPHISTRHVTHINELRHIYEWDTSHIWMSHVVHMDVSHHNPLDLRLTFALTRHVPWQKFSNVNCAVNLYDKLAAGQILRNFTFS